MPQDGRRRTLKTRRLLWAIAVGAGAAWHLRAATAWVPGHLARGRSCSGLSCPGGAAMGSAAQDAQGAPRGAGTSASGGRSASFVVGTAALLAAATAAVARPWRAAGATRAGGAATASRALVAANPATCWPPGKPALTTEYSEVYDLSDPKGSFTRVGQMMIEEMKSELPELYEMPSKEVEWVERSLQYNTQGGKMNRGLITVQTGVEIMKFQGKTPTNTDLHRFAVLGWAVEFLQACMLMADDMMDGSLTRRGNPCWYRLDSVGLLNTNDFLMVEMFVYKLLKRHFGSEEYFPWLVDLFLETTFQTECGQLLDSICANCELEELTTSRWELLVKYKTAFYSFYLPVALSMIVTGVTDRRAYDTAREALLLMGVYFQAQDDYLDAFACPEELGKVGTDIQDKKCSWLFAHAYHEHGTEEARALLDEHYGKCKVGSDEEEMIKELYKKLGLQELFQQYEKEVEGKVEDFQHKVDAVGLPWSIFERFFSLIHKRRK